MVGTEEIRHARERIAGGVERTPCLRSEPLSERSGTELWLKLETLQRTGSFKARGALNRLLQLDEDERRRGVIAASAGNHAQGVAYAASRLGVAATIVMPETTPLIKVSRTRAYGARVVLDGQTFDEALARARELLRSEGYVFVPAFDDELIIAGQGTLGLELLEQVPEIEAVVVPIGGGGLISGVAAAVKGLRPEIRVFGVQSRAAPAMERSFHAGELQAVELRPSIAEGITVKHPGELTFRHIRELVDDVVLVSEEEIEDAVYTLLETAKAVVEGAGAAATAAVLARRIPELAGRRAVAVVSGGNIDLNVLGRIIERSLARQHRLARLRITLRDRPGALAALLTVVAREEANVLRIHHDRVFSHSAFWETQVELTLETRDQEHVARLLEALRASGYVGIEELGLGLTPAPLPQS